MKIADLDAKRQARWNPRPPPKDDVAIGQVYQFKRKKYYSVVYRLTPCTVHLLNFLPDTGELFSVSAPGRFLFGAVYGPEHVGDVEDFPEMFNLKIKWKEEDK